MPESPSTVPPDDHDLAQELERSAADLHALAEQIGAVPVGSLKTYSVGRARITFAILVAVAGLVAWVVWSHWHSLWAGLAPLVWIFWRGWRFQRRGWSKAHSERDSDSLDLR
jgi:hypothetical protein